MRKLRSSLFAIVLLMVCSPLFSQTEPSFSKMTPAAEMLFKQALKVYDQGDTRQARKMFMQALEKDPANASLLLFLANTARSGKEYAEYLAKAQANMSNASEWDKLELAINESNLTGDFDKRLAAAKNMVATYPKSARALVELGATYAANNETDKARDAYMKATKLWPGWVGGYSSLAGSYVFDEPKDFAMGQKYAEQAAKIAPTSASLQILVGDVYRAQKNLERARDAYTAAINLQKEEPEAYYKRGHANTYLGKYDDARTDYGNAGKYDDIGAFATQNIAFTYLYANDSKKAFQSLTDEEEKLSAMDPMTMEAKYNILSSAAYIAMHNGDAANLATIIAKMEPLGNQLSASLGSKEAMISQDAEVLYWKALLQAVQGNYAAADETAQKMKSTLEPINNPRKLETYSALMGYINFKQNKFDKAIDDLQKANRNNIYDRYWLARAYEAGGSKEKATDIYKEIADNNFNSIGYALIRNEVKQKVAQ